MIPFSMPPLPPYYRDFSTVYSPYIKIQGQTPRLELTAYTTASATTNTRPFIVWQTPSSGNFALTVDALNRPSFVYYNSYNSTSPFILKAFAGGTGASTQTKFQTNVLPEIKGSLTYPNYTKYGMLVYSFANGGWTFLPAGSFGTDYSLCLVDSQGQRGFSWRKV